MFGLHFVLACYFLPTSYYKKSEIDENSDWKFYSISFIKLVYVTSYIDIHYDKNQITV